jgi:hypothetical protein
MWWLLLLRSGSYQIRIYLAVDLGIVLSHKFLHLFMLLVIKVIICFFEKLFAFIDENLVTLAYIRLALLFGF